MFSWFANSNDLIDLWKAFNTINQEILLKKTWSYRFFGSMYTIVSFISLWPDILYRNQPFFIENQLSDYGKVLCGVLQGSILGPLLFLIYASNRPQAVKSNLFLYVHDSCLMYQHRDVKILKNN